MNSEFMERGGKNGSGEGGYGMDQLMYIMMIEKTKTYNKLTKKAGDLWCVQRLSGDGRYVYSENRKP